MATGPRRGTESDLFEQVFAVLKLSLSLQPTDTEKLLHEGLLRSAGEHAVNDADHELQYANTLKQTITERFSRIAAVFESSVAEITAARGSCEAKASAHNTAMALRIQSQRSVAERRLQELVLEIIGEYGKSLLRGKRREAFVVNSKLNDLVLLVWRLQWSRFSARLKHDLVSWKVSESGLALDMLSPSRDGPEIARVLKRLSRKIGLLTERTFKPQAIVRISKPAGRSPPSVAGIFHLAESPDELGSALQTAAAALSGPAASPRPTSKASSKASQSSKPSSSDFLTCESIGFLHLPSLVPHVWSQALPWLYGGPASPHLAFARFYETLHGSALFSQRLYVCLEERSLMQLASCLPATSPAMDQALEPLVALQEIYVDYPHLHAPHIAAAGVSGAEPVEGLQAMRALLRDGTWAVREQALVQHHQSAAFLGHGSATQSVDLQAQLLHFPEVVCAQSLLDPALMLHFAPALVANLAECSTDGPGGGLGLYSLVWSPTARRQQGILRPVPPTADAPPSVSARIEAGLGCAPPPVASPSATPPAAAAPPAVLVAAVGAMALEVLSAHMSRSQRSTEGWSSLVLLPDHAVVRCSLYAQPRYVHSYALLDLDQRPQSSKAVTPSSSGVGAAVARTLYLVQLLDTAPGAAPPFFPPLGAQLSASSAHDFLAAAVSAELSEAIGEVMVSSSGGGGTEGSDKEPVPEKKGKSWDSRALSNFCQWRACTSAAGPGGALCGHHRSLQSFLDLRLGNASESSKYLPKRPPALSADVPEHKRDLMTIRSASTLLQELWDGRLRQTLKLFNRKVAADVKVRNFLEAKLGVRSMQRWLEDAVRVKGLQEFPPPTWIVWRDQDLFQRMVERQEASLALLRSIVERERLASQEIAHLSSLQVFPGQEVTLVRKDLRSLREKQEASLQEGEEGQPKKSGAMSLELLSDNYDNLISLLRDEFEVCERKMGLFQERRAVEEEARTQALRRQARMRAVAEETQAKEKDPANFRYQSGRF